jgi:phosphotransferase system IIA component
VQVSRRGHALALQIESGQTELIHIGQVVLALNDSLDYLPDTVFNYRTLAQGYYGGGSERIQHTIDVG